MKGTGTGLEKARLRRDSCGLQLTLQAARCCSCTHRSHWLIRHTETTTERFCQRQGHRAQHRQHGTPLCIPGCRYTWLALCQADTDGDGQTNGLNDPCCVWTEDDTPAYTNDITIPGDSGSTTSRTMPDNCDASSPPPPLPPPPSPCHRHLPLRLLPNGPERGPNTPPPPPSTPPTPCLRCPHLLHQAARRPAPGAKYGYTVRQVFTVAGTLDAFDSESVRAALLRTYSGATDALITATSGSVNVDAQLVFLDEVAAMMTQSSIASQSPSTFGAMLGVAILTMEPTQAVLRHSSRRRLHPYRRAAHRLLFLAPLRSDRVSSRLTSFTGY